MKLNCIIVDDEPIARKGLAEYIAEIDFLELKGECENAIVANNILNHEKIDLMLLDIQMPKMTGPELIKALPQKPMIVFTTAYTEYAVQSFELDVLDYLVKPISFERFLKACNKAKELYALRNTSPEAKTGSDHFFVKSNDGFEKILYSELLYVEAMENYVVLHTIHKKVTSYLTFKSVTEHLPASHFLKVHKSYIISLDKVSGVTSDDILIGKQPIPISRGLKDEVMNTLVHKNLLKR